MECLSLVDVINDLSIPNDQHDIGVGVGVAQ